MNRTTKDNIFDNEQPGLYCHSERYSCYSERYSCHSERKRRIRPTNLKSFTPLCLISVLMPIVTGCEKKPVNLHDAAASGNINYVQRYISSGADINATDMFGRTPLHLAADKGHKDVADLLLANRADLNAKITYDNYDQKTFKAWALQQALFNRRKAFEHMKISLFFYGCTPLHFAAHQSHIEVAKLLLDKGADVNAKGCNERIPLHYAAGKGHQDMAQLLIAKGADVNAKSENINTPLHTATIGGRRNVAELLIDKGADVNAKNKDGRTPLLFAAVHTQKDMAQLLIEKGADLNAKDKDGVTPLHRATRDVAELLIDKGADLNATDKFYGRTPLHYTEKPDVAELMIEKGADINAKDNRDHTPLHIVATFGHKDVAQVLIEKGADINAKDKNNRTPLTLAKDKRHRNIVRLLRKHGAKE